MKIIIIILLLCCHIVVSIIGTRKVKKSIILEDKKKRLNIVLLWFIPFLWYWILLTILKTTPGSSEFSNAEKHNVNHFHESGKGAPGSGIRGR